MRPILLALLVLSVSLAASQPLNCTPSTVLTSTMNGCLQNNQDAVYLRDSGCTIVACAPKNIQNPPVCLDSTRLSGSVQLCLVSGLYADVYGNSSCSFVKCVAKSTRSPGSGGTNQIVVNQTNTTSTSILDTVMGLGNKYGTIIGGVFTVIIAIVGWHFTQRNKNTMGKYLTHIDTTYSSFKMNAQDCETELHKLRKSITEDLKKGKLEESSYAILEKRIDDYLKEVRDQIKFQKKMSKKSK